MDFDTYEKLRENALHTALVLGRAGHRSHVLEIDRIIFHLTMNFEGMEEKEFFEKMRSYVLLAKKITPRECLT